MPLILRSCAPLGDKQKLYPMKKEFSSKKWSMKKGKWSKEEDSLIINHIQKYGIGRSWQGLSNDLGLRRCGRSCRSRWLNYLRPGLKHGNFTPAEERIICEMYRKRGSCWSVIAAQLPGRTDLAIKNYWNSTLKKRLPAATSTAARRRHRPAGSTSSDAATPELALVVYKEGSVASAGSSSHAGGVDMPVVLAGSPPVQVHPAQLPAAGNAAKEEPIAAVPISGSVRIDQKPPAMGRDMPPEQAPPSPPPPGDLTGAMDIVCVPMSPIPLSFMEPDEDDLLHITGFDDIDSLLSFFDD